MKSEKEKIIEDLERESARKGFENNSTNKRHANRIYDKVTGKESFSERLKRQMREKNLKSK